MAASWVFAKARRVPIWSAMGYVAVGQNRLLAFSLSGAYGSRANRSSGDVGVPRLVERLHPRHRNTFSQVSAAARDRGHDVVAVSLVRRISPAATGARCDDSRREQQAIGRAPVVPRPGPGAVFVFALAGR